MRVTAWCTQCLDEFAPVEYTAIPQDPSEPRFCSAQCEEWFRDLDEQFAS